MKGVVMEARVISTLYSCFPTHDSHTAYVCVLCRYMHVHTCVCLCVPHRHTQHITCTHVHTQHTTHNTKTNITQHTPPHGHYVVSGRKARQSLTHNRPPLFSTQAAAQRNGNEEYTSSLLPKMVESSVNPSPLPYPSPHTHTRHTHTHTTSY